jgi:7,8-dihydroneopterin aldolase/epimerase/oxygenase
MNLTKSLLKIQTTKLNCPIGYYKEERILGNDFELEISARRKCNEMEQFDDLAHSVNYELVSKIIDMEMKKENLYIEKVCHTIFGEIKELSKEHFWTVKIKKLTVPLNNICFTEFTLSNEE